MPTDTAQEKQQIHDLVDRLAPSQVPPFAAFWKPWVDPVARSIAKAPVDDEPVSAEDQQALEEAREWMKHNEGIPHEQVLAELGISQAEIESYKEPA